MRAFVRVDDPVFEKVGATEPPASSTEVTHVTRNGRSDRGLHCFRRFFAVRDLMPEQSVARNQTGCVNSGRRWHRRIPFARWPIPRGHSQF
jgi:hypothetical protein